MFRWEFTINPWWIFHRHRGLFLIARSSSSSTYIHLPEITHTVIYIYIWYIYIWYIYIYMIYRYMIYIYIIYIYDIYTYILYLYANEETGILYHQFTCIWMEHWIYSLYVASLDYQGPPLAMTARCERRVWCPPWNIRGAKLRYHTSELGAAGSSWVRAGHFFAPPGPHGHSKPAHITEESGACHHRKWQGQSGIQCDTPVGHCQ